MPVLVHRPSGPTTPIWQRHQALPPDRFGLFPFRSPLLRESQLLSLPRGTQMFQFPRFPPLVLFYSDQGHTPLRVRGFPIRTSTDRSLIGSSPWLIAAIHVLHRHQAPRHPPLALCSLEINSKRCSCLLSNSQGTAGARRCAPRKRNRGGPGQPELTTRGRSLRSMVTSWEARVTSDRLGVRHTM